jgi:hypothetical protein
MNIGKVGEQEREREQNKNGTYERMHYKELRKVPITI